MNRFYCTLVFGLPVLVGLAICQNTARGDDATDALLTAATSSERRRCEASRALLRRL